jgi:calpain-15
LGSDDIEQGSLGDCYFLASIAAVAEFPERCKRLFLTKQVDKQAIYAVALCQDGIWTDVVLDDLIPCQPVSKTPLFNRSAGRELWVILLEKAWAKVNGGFQNIAAGLCREALRTLTGASCKTFFTQQDREEIWKAIDLADEMNFIITAASDDLDNGSDAYQDKVGICGSHAYSLIATYEITRNGPNGAWRKLSFKETPTGQVERLVKLRNPWGSSEWKGSWSDTDPQWTDALRKQLQMTSNPDDGVFCMTYNDFCKYFSDLQICYFHDDYKYSAVKLRSEKGEKVMLSFEIHVEGVYYVSVNQKMTRAFPKAQKYAYSNLSFTLNKIGPGKECKFVAGQTRDDFENWAEVKLTPGNYAVEIKTNWTSCVNEFSFSVYGPETIPIGVTTAQALPRNMTERAITSAAEEDTDTPTLTFASQGHPDISYKIFDNKNGAGYVYFRNDSPNVTLSASADLTKSQNIALKSPREGLNPHVSVDPGETTSIAFEATKLPYSFQMQLATSFDIIQNRQELMERTRQSTLILKRKDEAGQELPIWAHVLRYEEGMGVLYINKHPELSICDRVQFRLDNCHIEGATCDSFEVVVRPNSEKFLNLIRIDKSRPFTAEVVKVDTKVSRAG